MDNITPDYEQTSAGSVETTPVEAPNSNREPSSQNKKKKFKMFCFSCNRPEYHSLKSKRRWLFSYILGMTFGLSALVGPFSCSCCGNSRLMCRNWLSVRYLFRKRRANLASSSRR